MNRSILEGPGIPVHKEPGPPPVNCLLSAAAAALELKLRRPAGELKVVASSRRTYSAIWELESGSGHYILKWLPRRAERELELTVLSQQLFADTPFIRTPRVACCPTPDTFLVERLPGVPLQSVCTVPPLWGLTRWLDTRRELLGRVGTWLKAFHATAVKRESTQLAGIKAYVLKREPGFRALDRELVDGLLGALEGARTGATVRIHGDFTPHNVLVSGDTVAVIDLAGITEFERDTACFDAAAMVVGLEESWRGKSRNHLRYYSRPIREMIASFLHSAGISSNDQAFPICYAVRHFTRICTLFRQTGRAPRPGNWHVRQLRLAIEQPTAIQRLTDPWV